MLMAKLEKHFRFNNDRALEEMRNFVALSRESIAQRHGRLARLVAGNLAIIARKNVVRLFLGSYTPAQIKAN